MQVDYDSLVRSLKMAVNNVSAAQRSIGVAEGCAYPNLQTQQRLIDAVCHLLVSYVAILQCQQENMIDPSLPWSFQTAFRDYVKECLDKADAAISESATHYRG